MVPPDGNQQATYTSNRTVWLMLSCQRQPMVARALFLAALTTFGCMRASSTEDSRVRLIRPISGGYDVADSLGRSIRVVPKPGGQVSFFSPSLDAAFYTLADTDSNSFVASMRFSDDPPVEVARSARLQNGGGDVPRIRWARADGRVALLVTGSRVERIEYCSGAVKRSDLQDGVSAVSLGLSQVVYSLLATPTVLHFQPESGSSPTTTLELPCSVGEIWAGFANQAVLVQCDGKEHSLFWVEAGHPDGIAGPSSGQIVDLLPIVGTYEAAVELGDGGERLDGTQKTAIGLWDLKTRRWQHLLDNSKMYQLQPAPSNSLDWSHRLCGA